MVVGGVQDLVGDVWWCPGFYTTIHNKLHFVLVAYDMHVCNFNNLNESVLFYCAYADS